MMHDVILHSSEENGKGWSDFEETKGHSTPIPKFRFLILCFVKYMYKLDSKPYICGPC